MEKDQVYANEHLIKKYQTSLPCRIEKRCWEIFRPGKRTVLASLYQVLWYQKRRKKKPRENKKDEIWKKKRVFCIIFRDPCTLLSWSLKEATFQNLYTRINCKIILFSSLFSGLDSRDICQVDAREYFLVTGALFASTPRVNPMLLFHKWPLLLTSFSRCLTKLHSPFSLNFSIKYTMISLDKTIIVSEPKMRRGLIIAYMRITARTTFPNFNYHTNLTCVTISFQK